MNFDSDSLSSHSEIDNNGKLTTNVNFTQFSTRYDCKTRTIWCWLQPKPRPCLNPTLISELEQLQCRLKNIYTHQRDNSAWQFKHLILASRSPDIFNLGGDLGLFKELIVKKDEINLQQYAYRCIQLLHQNIINLDLPITIISLIQGQALGGGFECALSCDVIIAERGTQMGFPEILFNLFPGMGAYNLLARRIGPGLAERMILSGQTYSAEELYEMGVVDVLADKNQGIKATERYLKHHQHAHNTIESIKKVSKIVQPVTEQDLIAIVDIWVESALQLTDKDLNKMQRLIDAQNTLHQNKIHAQSKRVIRQGEWRKNDTVDFPLLTHLGETVLHNRRHNQAGRRAGNF